MIMQESAKTISFLAVMLAGELDLNRLAGHFGITDKLSWEDPLRLTESHLTGIVQTPADKEVYIFHFGSAVFVNMAHHEIMDVVNYLKKLGKNVTGSSSLFSEDYRLEIVPEASPVINNDVMTAPELQPYMSELIATVLAKSVALEKAEHGVASLLDKIEEVIDRLENGQLDISDEHTARISAKILRFKYNMLSYIMLLDKPDITWVNADAEALFTELSTVFELNDRYANVNQKSEVLLDITKVFSGLTHAKRSTRLEWLVILLFAVEIVLSLITMYWQH